MGDAEYISLHPPAVPEQSLHTGINIDKAALHRDSSTSSREHFHAGSDDTRRLSRSIEIARETDGVSEQSPLLPSQPTEDIESLPTLESVWRPSEASNSNWVRDYTSPQPNHGEETKSSWQLFLLTVSMFGLQFAWSVELSNGSPYLLSLGISKSLLAFVWIAGPLSGTLVQPYVGIMSDRCSSRFGKRRPSMLGGAVATAFSLLALGWAAELIASMFSVFGEPGDFPAKVGSVVFAVLMIYVLDFSINVVQAGIRAFVVDVAPANQQESANAWAARLSGLGNIAGYLLGYIDLPKYFWFLGNTQFKVLCSLASMSILVTVVVSCFTVKERDGRLEAKISEHRTGILAFFKELLRSINKLPLQIKRICIVQFFAWIGWFPFLFYISTYIGEIYVQPYSEANPHMSKEEIKQLWQQATRVGTFALFVFAVASFVASVLLPLIVASSSLATQLEVATPTLQTHRLETASSTTGQLERYPLQTADSLQSSKSTSETSSSGTMTVTRLYSRLSSLDDLRIPWLTLPRVWMLSHILFALLTWATFYVHTTTAATIIVGLLGIPWAMTNWAPFALIAAQINTHHSNKRPHVQNINGDHGQEEECPQAGVVLGIHNVAIAAPQVIATLVSSAIFHAMQKERGSVGDESVAWVLRFGGLAALIAAWLTRRVGRI